MDLPMSCLSSNTQHGAGATGQAQHSNINASSDGSNNNTSNNSGNCCFGWRRSQTRLPYWPSPTTISDRGSKAEEEGREGKSRRERKRRRVGKTEGGTDRVKVEVRWWWRWLWLIFKSLFILSSFLLLGSGHSSEQIMWSHRNGSRAEQSSNGSSRSQIYRLEWEQQQQLDGTGPDPRVGVHSATISTSRCLWLCLERLHSLPLLHSHHSLFLCLSPSIYLYLSLPLSLC